MYRLDQPEQWHILCHDIALGVATLKLKLDQFFGFDFAKGLLAHMREKFAMDAQAATYNFTNYFEALANKHKGNMDAAMKEIDTLATCPLKKEKGEFLHRALKFFVQIHTPMSQIHTPMG